MTSREIERLEAIKKGDIQEFELLFREFYQPLLNYAMAIIKSEPDAEEVVQDIFFVLWKNKKSLTIHSSISAYLYKAVQNNCLQLIRYQKRKLNYQQDHQIENEYESLSPGEVLQYNELYNEINRIVDELPENCKTIFRLNRFHGLKNSEIAEKLAISINLEAAELLENFQWNNEYDLDNISDELADIFLYCLLMADTVGIDLEKATLHKIEKNKLKYPVEKAKDSSKKYTQL